jgi:hypothetical protein
LLSQVELTQVHFHSINSKKGIASCFNDPEFHKLVQKVEAIEYPTASQLVSEHRLSNSSLAFTRSAMFRISEKNRFFGSALRFCIKLRVMETGDQRQEKGEENLANDSGGDGNSTELLRKRHP